MKKGELSKPFLSQFGYHINLKDKKTEKNLSFLEVQDSIKEILLKSKLNELTIDSIFSVIKNFALRNFNVQADTMEFQKY